MIGSEKREKREKKEETTLKRLKGRVQNSLSGLIRAVVLGLLILLQVGFIAVLPLALHEYSSGFYIALEICGLVGILALTNDNRNFSYKFSWLCIILVLPVSGLIMFLLWGRVGKGNTLHKKIINQFHKTESWLVADPKLEEDFVQKYPLEGQLSKYMYAKGSPIFKNNEFKYYATGEDAFEDIITQIAQAKKFILLEFFIVAEGALWDQVHEILKQKLQEGVEVKFLYDDFGAILRTGTDFSSKLRTEGFEVQIFNPIHKYASKLYMNFRNHQKMVIVDGNVGFTGGFNIADEYANLVERFGVWKDAGIRVEGDAVWAMTVAFFEMWEVTSGQEIDLLQYSPDREFNKNNGYCHILRDGPALGPQSYVGSVVKQIANYSIQRLYIMTPYLILEETLSRSLIEAKKRGVDVRIVTPGIPDKKHIKYLTEYYYGHLLHNGIRIFEYQPGFVHSKVILSDQTAMVSTINLDYRSFYLHYENGIWLHDAKTIRSVERDFEKTLKECKEIHYSEWLNRPRRIKILQYILNVFSTLV